MCPLRFERCDCMRIAVSWSGGKDCCLALHRLREAGHEVACLISMVSSEHQRSRTHGIPLPALQLQADALGLPLIMMDSGVEYGVRLRKAIEQAAAEYGAEAVAFGTLYSERDRGWNEGVAMAAGVMPLFPVWIRQVHTSHLLHELISLGYEAVVCRASEEHFERTWAGRRLDWQFYREIHDTRSCPMGENGEYHTFVLNGPHFHRRLELTRTEVVLNAGLWSLDLQGCRLGDRTI